MAKMSLKWPKTALCEIRAAWSGVFSIPGGTTGPGFKAEIRPPLFSLFFDHFFVILCFHIYAFCWFLHFWLSDKLCKSMWSPFFDHFLPITVRPYYIIEGRIWYVWWFSPHLVFVISGIVFVLFMSGRLHRRGDNFSNSVLPSLNRFYLLCFSCRLSSRCRGDSQGAVLYVLSFSPLWTGWFGLWSTNACSDVGEILQERRFILNSRSPLYETKIVGFAL